MTEAPRPATGSFLPRTVAPGRERSGVGIVWLDRLSLVAGDGRHPSFGPGTADVRSGSVADRERTATVGATVEVPPGYLVVDVRVGYAVAAGGFAGELRVVDRCGHRKSALLFLERRPAGDEAPERVFVDAPTAHPGKPTLLSIRASVAELADHVAVRGLRLSLSRA